MKSLTVVLASGVTSSLAMYALFASQGWIAISLQDLVMMRVPVVIGLFAGLGFGSAALALAFQRGLARADAAARSQLEARVARLEAATGARGGDDESTA